MGEKAKHLLQRTVLSMMREITLPLEELFNLFAGIIQAGLRNPGATAVRIEYDGTVGTAGMWKGSPRARAARAITAEGRTLTVTTDRPEGAVMEGGLPSPAAEKELLALFAARLAAVIDIRAAHRLLQETLNRYLSIVDDGSAEERCSDETGLEEYRIETTGKEGIERHIQVWRNPLVRDGEERYQVLYEDITRRKQAEEEREAALTELRRSQGILESIIEFLPDATFVIDREGTVIAWNRAMENLTGVPAGDMLGRGDHVYAPVFYGEIKPMLIDIALLPELEGRTDHARIDRKGDVFYAEALTPALPKGDVYLTATASVLRDTEGTVIGAVECFRNETERKKLEERIQQTEKMISLSRVSTGVAHEILNPLGIISLALQRVKTLGDLSPDVLEELDVCARQVERIARIADGLKQYARSSSEAMAPADINDIIDGVLRMYRLQLKIEEMTTDLHYSPGLPSIPLNREKMEQVLINLFSNALGAMEGKEDRLLSVRTEHRRHDDGEYLRIVISDNGTGIRKKDLGRIFDPFYTTRAPGRGTGMGLSISQGIIRRHGGRIWAQNNRWGGASFFIELPVTGEGCRGMDSKPERSDL
ncbi:MAG: ATP-binding protein [Syntrophales bacterium]|nr:ATP-binding protein [Syntrophales bacterium]MCK9528036.1 ATP-binding protein [Syntrophales bacterium]MDX9921387.1 ATP-binding protein [Syntrophales bacterium]